MSTSRQEAGLHFSDYRAQTDFVSVSELKSFIQSPYSYYKRYIQKEPDPNRKSAGMVFGTLCHALILEPDQFNKEYLVSDVRRDARTNAYKEVLEEAGNRAIISPAEFERAKKVQESAMECLTENDFTDLIPEISYFYEGRDFTTKVKARFDAFSPKHKAIVDLKTTNSLPTYNDVVKTILNFKYHLQVAFYMDIHQAVTGHYPKAFWFVFALSEFPFASVAYKMDDEFIEEGRAEYQDALKELGAALENKTLQNFPRIKKQEQVLTLPSWYRSKRNFKEIGEK